MNIGGNGCSREDALLWIYNISKYIMIYSKCGMIDNSDTEYEEKY